MSVLDSIRLPNRPDLLNCRTIDRLALPLLSEMERVGTAINVPGLQAMSVDLQARMLELEAKVRKHVPVDKLREFLNRKSNTPQRPPSSDNQFDSLSDSNYQDAMEAEDNDDGVGEGEGEEIPVDAGLMNFAFNVNSAEKIAWLLFEVLDLGRGETLDTTPDGKRVSTGKKQLERLKDKHDVVKDLLDYREVAKLKSTYVDKLPSIAVRHDKGLCRYCGLRHSAVTHRVHTQFVTTRTETGRAASRNPNLMNIPARSDLGREVRSKFIPTPGMKWVSVDKSQIELRSLAHCANDVIMQSIYTANEDIHIKTAVAAFNLGPEDKVDKFMHRGPAKVVNFGVCLAHGQRVLTHRGPVPIQNVRLRDRVWDGVEWVSHEGLICRGKKLVISWCGVTATPDHKVWLRSGVQVSLEQARDTKAPLMCTAHDRETAVFGSPCSCTWSYSVTPDRIEYVYDLLNAGPRHRFTVEGRLVSNCYGMSSKGLYAQMILMLHQAGQPIPDWLTEQWCEDFINKWFALYPYVRAYMEYLHNMARRYGMVWNEFGRVRQIQGVWSVHKHLVSECLRQAGNMPIQGFAAELMKLWMALVLDDHGEGLLPLWRERGLVYPLLTVHDELNFEAEESIADDMVADLLLAEEYMGEALGLRCPLLADGGVSDYWKK